MNRRYNADILSSSKAREQRLREIEKIRESFAQRRNNTIDEFTKDSCYYRKPVKLQPENGYKARLLMENVNSSTPKNPEISRNDYRAKGSPITRLNPDSSKYYDEDFANKIAKKYSHTSHTTTSPLRISKNADNLSQFGSIRNRASTIERENVANSITKQYKYDSRCLRSRVNHQTFGALNNISKYDQVQKSRKISRPDSNYNLSNITKIQQRIQKVLGTR